jgi:hypothetical protein
MLQIKNIFLFIRSKIFHMESSTQIQEAKRYLDNAKELLTAKANKEGDYYRDSKYVRMAGDTAWKGALMALDAVFNVKQYPKHRVSVEDYKAAVAKRNKQLLTRVNGGYQILHITMGYDGLTNYRVCQEGLKEAQTIIDWCESNVAGNISNFNIADETAQ